jgi:hypothetical protein
MDIWTIERLKVISIYFFYEYILFFFYDAYFNAPDQRAEHWTAVRPGTYFEISTHFVGPNSLTAFSNKESS